MHVEPNIFRALEQEWRTLGTSDLAITALERWCRVEPKLAGYASPAAIVDGCQRRNDPKASNAVLGALLRLADDSFARRTLLQALLPSIARRATRAARLAGAFGSNTVAEWSQEMIVRTLERIDELAGTSTEWPAVAIMESAWWRVEVAIGAEHRRQRNDVPLDASTDPAAPPDRTPAEQLVGELVDAVRGDRIDRRAAGIIYTTRIGGHSFEEVAAWDGRGVAAVRKARFRAEAALAASTTR
jgi:hypothetical protein